MKLIFIFIIFIINNCNCKLIEVYRWKELAYADLPDNVAIETKRNIFFPGDEYIVNSKQNNLSSYIPYNNVPLGATHHKGRLFITIPRRRFGIPATLNFIDMNRQVQSNKSPRLVGYPDYETNAINEDLKSDPNRIVSVYRTRVDACERLWFIDTGMLEIPNNRIQIQRPSIWIIDLKTNKRIRRFEIPESMVAHGNGFASLTIDVESNNCNDAYAYVPDLVAATLSVYSYRENKIWTFHHNYFSFDPLNGDFNIAGVQFQWDDGIFSITLGPKESNGYRTAYFLPMASISLFSVSTQVLQNETLANRDYHNDDFKFIGFRGKHKQTTILQYDQKSGIMFYAEVGRNAIGCWNTADDFAPELHGTVDQNNTTMIYPCDLNIDDESTVWVLSNTMPLFIYSRLDEKQYNFRIWRNTVRQSVRGTICSTSGDIGNRFGEEDEDDDDQLQTDATESTNTDATTISL